MGRKKEYNIEEVEFKGQAIYKKNRIVRNHTNVGIIIVPKRFINQKFDIILIPK
jgi:hypothetical protein